MKKRISARMAIVALLAVVAVLTVGVTLAYLHDMTDPLEEHFVPVEVACRVVMSDREDIAENVAVMNTGDISAYIRVATVVTWVSESSGTTYGGGPLLGSDYTVTMGDGGWFMGSDGFYYYKNAVAAGDVTPYLYASVAAVEGQAPEGYRLSVRFLASAIQSAPAEAVTSAWHNVTVAADNTLTPQ